MHKLGLGFRDEAPEAAEGLDWPSGVSGGEAVVCSLRHWHPWDEVPERYELHWIEWVHTTEFTVVRVVVDWPGRPATEAQRRRTMGARRRGRYVDCLEVRGGVPRAERLRQRRAESTSIRTRSARDDHRISVPRSSTARPPATTAELEAGAGAPRTARARRARTPAAPPGRSAPPAPRHPPSPAPTCPPTSNPPAPPPPRASNPPAPPEPPARDGGDSGSQESQGRWFESSTAHSQTSLEEDDFRMATGRGRFRAKVPCGAVIRSSGSRTDSAGTEFLHSAGLRPRACGGGGRDENRRPPRATPRARSRRRVILRAAVNGPLGVYARLVSVVALSRCISDWMADKS